MFYVGLDVHSKQITMCVLDDNGKVYRRCTVGSLAEMMGALQRLPGPFEACFEASTGYGVVYEMLLTLAARVCVAHPGLLRLIFRSKHKNDRNDAEKLAKLLYVGEVPLVHVPSAEVRAWRELITFRTRLVQKRTRAKNSVPGCCGRWSFGHRSAAACGLAVVWPGSGNCNCRATYPRSSAICCWRRSRT